MNISNIDKNLAVQSSLNIAGLEYRNALEEPFDIYGLYRTKETGEYIRMPEEIAAQVNEGVRDLNLNTAGGRIRFRTDSPYVTVKVELRTVYKASHMPFTGALGMDLYVYDGEEDLYKGSFIPPFEKPERYESVVHFPDAKMREITIHLPLYSGIKELWIGLDKDADVQHGKKYRPIKPILYYGSSITQGGCASRPGNNYSAAIARETNVDFLCLGFSGSARGEQVMVDYLAGLDASIFVCDYDHNAPDAEHLEATHLNLYQCYRRINPLTPIIFMSRPDICSGDCENIRRRDIVYQTYRTALERGDKNVHFLDGFQLFAGRRRNDCMVDGIHPNDLGFFRMAEAVGELVRYCLTSSVKIEQN